VWKHIGASVAGTSHTRVNRPCEDACHVAVAGQAGEPVLIAACADGAGTAANAARGSRLVCSTVVAAIERDLAEGLTTSTIDRDTVLSWYMRARAEVAEVADHERSDLRSFACTLSVAVVGEADAAFGQLGDGAIIVGKDDQYLPVFWPQAGEYANATYFLTDPNYQGNVEFARRDEGVGELAVLTDGLQRLALDFTARIGHARFFQPLFRDLRAAADPSALDGPLVEFLDSPRVNERTDDDKTLILATRLPPRAPAHHTV
jgi:hypothetical protein